MNRIKVFFAARQPSIPSVRFVRYGERARICSARAKRIAQIGLAAVALVSAGCGGTESEFESIESPDGRYVLIVTVTEPAFPHARHKVSAYVRAQGADDSQKLLETPLANDGVSFTARNIGLRWTSATTALVCLRPTDLADQGIRIDVSGTPTAEIRPGC
ncbi:MAG: hypothetical protein QF609_05145 [Gammaproteobacteria bacterium]|nr:hypothetical protein [Gammaproteobacteria bacterium]|tara:strand:+ start:126 stop:605 length:480 start_codon:yes stop_codon:yes gene_type:complete